jgi:hypothetical protein
LAPERGLVWALSAFWCGVLVRRSGAAFWCGCRVGPSAHLKKRVQISLLGHICRDTEVVEPTSQRQVEDERQGCPAGDDGSGPHGLVRKLLERETF